MTQLEESEIDFRSLAVSAMMKSERKPIWWPQHVERIDCVGIAGRGGPRGGGGVQADCVPKIAPDLVL